MKLAYFILLILLLGCVQPPPTVTSGDQYQNETMIEPPEQSPESTPEPEPETGMNITPPAVELASYLSELGFTIPWNPRSQDYSWIANYEISN